MRKTNLFGHKNENKGGKRVSIDVQRGHVLRIAVGFIMFGILLIGEAGAFKYEYAGQWGGHGNDNGRFDLPRGVVVDSSGNVYVADTENDRIQKFNSSGGFLTKWGEHGIGNGQFDSPWGVAVDSGGNVYVADTENDRIQKFNSSGGFLASWRSWNSELMIASIAGVAVSGGSIYITFWDFSGEGGEAGIQEFNSSGSFLRTWGSFGSGDGEFGIDNRNRFPEGVAVDSSSGIVFVADTVNDRIQEFNSSGGFLATFGNSGNGNGQFKNPSGVAADRNGNVFVVDTENDRIQRFKKTPGFEVLLGMLCFVAAYGLRRRD